MCWLVGSLMGETREHHSLSVPSLSKCSCLFWGSICPTLYSQLSENCLTGFSAPNSLLFILTICSSSLRCREQILQHLFKTMSLSSWVLIELKYKITPFTAGPGFLPGAGQNQEIQIKISKCLLMKPPHVRYMYE